MTTVPEPAARAVFRIPQLTILFALVMTICVTPVAAALPWCWLLYLLPLGVIGYVLRVRTTVDGATVTVRGLLRTRRVPWDQISSLRLGVPRWLRAATVSAVLTDGAELALPAVHVRDLPQLAAASNGRLPDPSGG